MRYSAPNPGCEGSRTLNINRTACIYSLLVRRLPTTLAPSASGVLHKKDKATGVRALIRSYPGIGRYLLKGAPDSDRQSGPSAKYALTTALVKGKSGATGIQEVCDLHLSDVFLNYGSLNISDLYLPDLRKGIISVFNGIKHVENHVTPTGNKTNILPVQGNGSIPISTEVKQIQLCRRRNCLVSRPGLMESMAAHVAVPHLAVSEYQYLVHDQVFLDEPVDNLISIGAVPYLTLSVVELKSIGEDAFRWKADGLPCISEYSGDYLFATGLEKHGKHETYIIAFDLAPG